MGNGLRRRVVELVCIAVLVGAQAGASAQPESGALRVLQAGPTGEVADLGQANEIRVIFSEPMVELGRVPTPVTVPFFTVTPAITGTFRWSGTTILVFTPDRSTPLPYATRFDVTIATSARAVSGRSLPAPHRFSFTTPTVKLLGVEWYRKDGRYDRPVVAALRFNQPVRPRDVLAHVTARYEPHDWVRPTLSRAARDRMQANDPQGLAQFETKVRMTGEVASASAPVRFDLAGSWDTGRYPERDTLVVLESAGAPPPDSWVRLTLDAQVPGVAGTATPRGPQTYTLELEPTFFVTGMACDASCDPSHRNPVELTQRISLQAASPLVAVVDVTNDARGTAVKPARVLGQQSEWLDRTSMATLEDLGFDRQPPATVYAIRLSEALASLDGQVLGYPWTGIVENWHERAFTSFGDGHGVWERTGGRQLPFYARNFRSVTQWAQRIDPAGLMPLVRELQENQFKPVPNTASVRRSLSGEPDQTRSYGLDLTAALGADGTGLIWAGIEEGQPIARATAASDAARKSTVVQATNLGVTVKDSPLNTLVMVTRLDTGEVVEGARVSLVSLENERVWSGTTNEDGIAMAPGVAVRDRARPEAFTFIVTAEKDGDIAYVGSDWTEGIEPWAFGTSFELGESEPLLRGTVFADRGVYRLGEEVHFKAILRRDTPGGIALLRAGTTVHVAVQDSQAREIDRRTLTVNDWSTAEWTYTLPAAGALGSYTVEARLAPPRAPAATHSFEEEMRESQASYEDSRYHTVRGGFLVAAYRRPDFRVDTTLTAADPIAGQRLAATVSARYLFGASVAKRPVRWAFSRTPVYSPPGSLRQGFTDERFEFVGRPLSEENPETGQVSSADAVLDAEGRFATSLETPAQRGLPFEYTFESEVEDVSRQRIANRASVFVHPAPWYVGIRRPGYFVDVNAGFSTDVVTVSPDGRVVAGVPVTLTLSQVQWHSVRRAEGGGFYAWETRREETQIGQWTVTSREAPVPVSAALPGGGFYVMKAVARDDLKREAVTVSSFYVVGGGYTAWTRYDHNRIDLVPERRVYKPGDAARIMVQSPWEQATALVTTEREGVRSHRRVALTSTQQTITVPIEEGDIPNVFVSVMLIKGRTVAGEPDDGSDPGKPSFRLGYVELDVEDASKRLSVDVRADKEEFRPTNTARVSVAVRDAKGQASQSEVTLWAVDYGVLSLTAFKTPDVLGSVYARKSLQVTTTDNRQRIVSRRVLTPKGTDDGGGGGSDMMASSVRKDFRVLAFWLGSVVTDAEGRASADVKLPESLTTYRIMAVAGDRSSRFGSADAEIRINKPLTLLPAFPRFLALGDRATFGSVVTSQLARRANASVSIRSLDPRILSLGGPTTKAVVIDANGSAEVRFDAEARTVGNARIRVSVQANGETDAFEEVVPVRVLAPMESVAAYGEAKPGAPATESLSAPSGVVAGTGGLSVQLSSTALVGLSESARYLVEYPYGCAEQIASRALAIALASDMGTAFRLPGVEPGDLRARTQEALDLLETFQHWDGGFRYWSDSCCSSPYLSSYVLHVFGEARSLKFDVDDAVLARGYDYLARQLGQPPEVNEGWSPAFTAWQAFAASVLVRGGRQQDAVVTRLFEHRDRMPVFALAHLRDAMVSRGETGERVADLRRRLANAILPEGGHAHVEELDDPYLLWFWNSNVRSTAIVLASFIRSNETDAAMTPMVRWLMDARKDGRWGNTQENAWAMQALVDYSKRFETDVPDFTAIVRLGDQPLVRSEFKGRSSAATRHEVPMATLLSRLPPGTSRSLTLQPQGTAGTLFYATHLRYVVDAAHQEARNDGFVFARSYARVADDGTTAASTTFAAGDLVRVTLSFELPKERRFVAVTDVLPAGFEPVDSWFATTARELARSQDEDAEPRGWQSWWQRGGFDHVERHDDRVRLFATRLGEGRHEFSYLVRATTAGTFRTASATVEEMYAPDVSGRTATAVLTIRPE